MNYNFLSLQKQLYTHGMKALYYIFLDVMQCIFSVVLPYLLFYKFAYLLGLSKQ